MRKLSTERFAIQEIAPIPGVGINDPRSLEVTSLTQFAMIQKVALEWCARIPRDRGDRHIRSYRLTRVETNI